MCDHDVLITAYQEQIAAMTRIMEAFPDKHVRFGIINKDGTFEEPTKCADWCYACTLDQLRARNASLKTKYGVVCRVLRRTEPQLRRARAEAAGRKAYAEDLKAALINQHVELCELTEKYTKLKDAVDAAYVLIDKHTPFGRYVPLRNVINWLIEDRNAHRTWSRRDARELRIVKDERFRAVGLLMDHGIYNGDTEQGIKELLNRMGRSRRTWRTILRRNK